MLAPRFGQRQPTLRHPGPAPVDLRVPMPNLRGARPTCETGGLGMDQTHTLRNWSIIGVIVVLIGLAAWFYTGTGANAPVGGG